MPETHMRGVWVTILALALVLHFAFLYQVPLSPGETSQALTSLPMDNHVDPSTMGDSVLLMLGNTLLFSIFGAGNGIARFIPALAGIGLVLIPFFWRRSLGHIGSITTAGVLLSSPLILFASRRVEGTVISTLAAALLLTTSMPMWTKIDRENQRNLFIVSGVSLGLLSGPAFWDFLFSGIAVWLFGHVLQKEKLDWQNVRTWGRYILVGLGVAMLVSIGFGFHWRGWNGILSGLSHWISSWAGTTDASYIGTLLLYEPFTLILAVVGVGFAWKQWDSLSLRITLWALLNLLIASLRGGAPVTSMGTAILALAYLSGYGIQHLISDMPGPLSKWILLHMGMGFVFLLPGLLGLTQYASGLISPGQPLLVLSGAIVVLALQVLLAFLFSLVLPMKVLWRSALLGVSLMCVYMQTGFLFQLNFVRPTSAIEPAVMSAGSPDTIALKQMVSEIAVRREEREDTLVITIVDGDPEVTNSLRWILRDYKRVRVSPTWPSEAELTATDMLVMTPESMDLSAVQTPGWKGMRFTVIEKYIAPSPGCRRIAIEDTTTIDCADWVNWYLYRTSPYPQSTKGVILWANQ